MKTIIVTGGAGFIGSNFIPYFLDKYSDYHIINFDNLTYAGNLENLNEIKDNKKYKFIKGDIRNRGFLEHLFSEYKVSDVIHFAAESHVDNSIEGPEIFMTTNLLGTFNLVHSAMNYWNSNKLKFNECRFLHVSTDEVYGSLGKTGLFTENTQYSPNSPYSASKAGSDMIIRSYHHTFGLNTVITNCTNNFGPKQHYEKLIPTIIRNALKSNLIPIYGDGKNVRDWLYVLDHCKGIDTVFHKGFSGETYNIGACNEKENIYLAKKICDILDELKPRADKRSYKEQLSFVKDRLGHDRRYAIDPTKIETELGWKAEMSFEQGLYETVNWYIEKFSSK